MLIRRRRGAIGRGSARPPRPASRDAAACGWDADVADEDALCKLLALDPARGSE